MQLTQGSKAKRTRGDVLRARGFYFPSPNSHISLFPIHHSDTGLSYKQMTKDSEAQGVTGGTSGYASLARALWFRAPDSVTPGEQP